LPCSAGLLRTWVDLKPEAVSEARQVIEDADDVSDFETRFVVES